MAKLTNTTINDTGSLVLPLGNTSQRLGRNTGATVVSLTTVGSGTWTVPAGVTSLEVLVVAGGGGGGFEMGGGGGGGGVVYQRGYAVTPGQGISYTVGGGGAGRTSNADGGGSGGNSVFGSITAIGGGAGGNNGTQYAQSGGSGGGQGEGQSIAAGTDGQGHAGGRAVEQGDYQSGGGGGAGGPGEDGGSGGRYYDKGPGKGGDGGVGMICAITGDARYYGGGGGGGVYLEGEAGRGGLGGGGNAGYAGQAGTSGAANTGGGGGGGSYSPSSAGGAGGSGIIVIRYSTSTSDFAEEGSMRLSTSHGGLEYFSGGTWRSMSIPFAVRSVIQTAYMMGGYKDSSAWNNVNRIQTATDTTHNLGDNSIESAFNYQWGASGKNISYVFGAGNGHAVSSNYTIGYNMRTESQYTSHSRYTSYAGINKGGTFEEHYRAWITGGGSSTIDEFNMMTETFISTYSGWSSTNQWGMSHDGWGSFYWENDSRVWHFATRTAATWSGTQPSVYHQQKSIQSKASWLWAGNEGSYNGGYNFRQTNAYTKSTSATYAKPRGNCGEENFTMGQDHAYMLGNYDGSGQNNGSFRWNYATNSGFNGDSSMEPKGKTGASSGVCAWRD